MVANVARHDDAAGAVAVGDHAGEHRAPGPKIRLATAMAVENGSRPMPSSLVIGDR